MIIIPVSCSRAVVWPINLNYQYMDINVGIGVDQFLLDKIDTSNDQYIADLPNVITFL